MKHSFGSDNHSGAAPEIIRALEAANKGFQIAYGDDEYTSLATKKLRDLLGEETYPFFVFNGTGANVVCLQALTRSFNSIICSSSAHINVDECGAPEKFTNSKLISVNNIDGKITLDSVKKELHGFGFQHHSQPNVVSISQPTELGTLYTVEEIKALANLIHSYGGYLHMDGSRISNAAASLNIPIKEFTSDAGVDALSFGGTKNGLVIGEIAIFFKKSLSENFSYIRKQSAQLFSKNRFISAQFVEYLNNNLYLKLATHSNSMAKYLSEKVSELDFVKISRPVETNAVFAYISKELFEKIVKKHFFYVWEEETYEVRWMCSFNTSKEDIDNFIIDLTKCNNNQT